jgi:ribosomal protein S18 acetylase RimI-like enzyme
MRGCAAAGEDATLSDGDRNLKRRSTATMGPMSQDTSSAEMAWAIEANLNATFALLDSSPNTQLHEDDPNLRWYITPNVPSPFFNHVYLTRLPKEEDVDTRIEELRKHFASHKLPLMWSVGPFSRPSELGSHLESHGFRCVEESPGMALDLKALNEDIAFPSELAIERVSNAEVLMEFVEVMRVGFEMPEFTAAALFEEFNAMGLTEESPWRNYVGRLDGEVVTTASLANVVGIAGIYNVVTLPKARRRGFGAAMTLAALGEARELGYRICILQSSAEGFGVYGRLGFEQYSTYYIYVGTWRE